LGAAADPEDLLVSPDPEDLRATPDPEDLRVADDPLEALRPPEPERAALADAERARVPEVERDDLEPPELLDELAFVALAPDRGDDDLPAAEPELLPVAREPALRDPAEPELLPVARERGDDALPDVEPPDDELPLGAEPPLAERGDRRRAGDAEEPLLDPDDARFLDVLRRGPPLSFSTAISSSLSRSRSRSARRQPSTSSRKSLLTPYPTHVPSTRRHRECMSACIPPAWAEALSRRRSLWRSPIRLPPGASSA
jgi:hypothetical protein